MTIDMFVCRFDGCERPVKCKGLCTTHYGQQRVGKDLTAITAHPHGTPVAEHCMVARCLRPVNGRGYCNMHYARWRRTGSPNVVRQIAKARFDSCTIQGCAAPVAKNNLCSKHEARARRFQLTDMQLNQILLDAKCEACGSTDNLQIDHDHACCDGNFSCGECIRGILCGPCNFILGNASDSPERLLALVAYLNDKPMRCAA